MKLLAPALALALAGCMTIEDHQAAAANASNFKVCRAYFLAPADISNVARQEAARRGLDCAPYMQAVMQGERDNSAAVNALSQQLLARPPAPQVPQQYTCTSRPFLNGMRTVCE